MTENEAQKWLERFEWDYSEETSEALATICEALQEYPKFKAIGTIEELQELKGVITDFPLDCGDTVTTVKEILHQLSKYLKIGTIEEFKALKENQRNCKDCAGCTNWKCDCANERDYAITQFANFLHEKAKENNGLRLSSETRSWTHPCIFDYLKEFKALKEKNVGKMMDGYYCPICRHYFEDTDAYNYCPVCGQKMKSILE